VKSQRLQRSRKKYGRALFSVQSLQRLEIPALGANRRAFFAARHGACNDTSQRRKLKRKEATMTPINHIAHAAPAAESAAENLLRDMAYVLKLTRRVKEELMTDRAPTHKPAGRKAEGVLVA
jgi:hypothetical protein